MNTSLLAKWLVQLNDASLVGKWRDIIIAKYENAFISPKISPF
jgi:hypothetical protein